MAAIQLANYLSLPFLLITILPMYYLGGMLFQSGIPEWELEQLTFLVQNDMPGLLKIFGRNVFYAIIAWIILVMPGTLIFHMIFRQLFREIKLKLEEKITEQKY